MTGSFGLKCLFLLILLRFSISSYVYWLFGYTVLSSAYSDFFPNLSIGLSILFHYYCWFIGISCIFCIWSYLFHSVVVFSPSWWCLWMNRSSQCCLMYWSFPLLLVLSASCSKNLFFIRIAQGDQLGSLWPPRGVG